MANSEQVKRLTAAGGLGWNEWRSRNLNAVIDLTNADLSGAHLYEVNLGRTNVLEGVTVDADGKQTQVGPTVANCRDANFSNAELSQVDLSGAVLRGANFANAEVFSTNLSQADLRGADLTGVHFQNANLSGAKLRGATVESTHFMESNLSLADLSGLDLSTSNLFNCMCHRTIFDETRLSPQCANNVYSFTDLSSTIDLNLAHNVGPSEIGIHTLLHSGTALPKEFLQGCGLPDTVIDYLASFANSPLEFYSCFISYSHKDKLFAIKLHDALEQRGIRSWLDEKQLLPGDHIRKGIDEGIQLWDKILVCCSRTALTESQWVEKELEKALKKEERLRNERGESVLALIPLNLDGFLFDPECPEDWKKDELTSRLAADFTGWESDSAKFAEQFEQVVKALRADEGARAPQPKSKL